MTKNIEISIKGHLPKEWSEWFEGFMIKIEGENSTMSGVVLDNAATHGIIERIRDLNLDLISVRITEEQ